MDPEQLLSGLRESALERIASAHPNANENANANSKTSDADFIRTAFVFVLSAEPTADELNLIGEMLPRLTEAARASNRPNPESYARNAVIQALLNHNDFVTIR